MMKFCKSVGAIFAATVLTACGSSSGTSQVSNSTAPGTLDVNPPFRIASLNAAAIAAELSANPVGAKIAPLTGTPACGVDVYYIKYWTVGAANEATLSTGAMMVPTGGTGCSGPRPIVLYSHATQFQQTFNIADVTNPTNEEGLLIAAMFAAQGYIVVAPNYAGYDISTLGYHPFLNAAQQSGEMMNALSAARTALPHTLSSATSDNGQLFLTGYSEGGHVAMATQRALQAAGATVTAAAPMSGIYALEAEGDALILGNVALGATAFVPMFTSSYQHAYGNIYSLTSDVYSTTYASGVATVLPNAEPLTTVYAEGLLPELALFDSTTPVVSIPGQALLSAELTAALAVPALNPANPQTALFRLGFGSPYLLNNDYRVSYALDAFSNPDGALPVFSPTTVPISLSLYNVGRRVAVLIEPLLTRKNTRPLKGDTPACERGLCQTSGDGFETLLSPTNSKSFRSRFFCSFA